MARLTIEKIFFVLWVVVSASAFSDPWNWDIAAANGQVSFEGTGRPSMLTIAGQGKKSPTGNFTFNGKKLSGDFKFELESLDTGISLRNDHMKKKYLEVEKFPTAHLTIADTAWSSGKSPFDGTLELHGVSKPVHGTMELIEEKNNLSVKAEFSLKVTDFGITIPSFSGITMTEKVDVKVTARGPETAKK